MSGVTDKHLSATPDVQAPDGSQVRILASGPRGSMARFRLEAGQVARAIVHRTVDEVWFVSSGRGRIWRKSAGNESVTELVTGLSLTIPAGTSFQFRCDGDDALDIIAVTMPPWPGDDEAVFVAGAW